MDRSDALLLVSHLRNGMRSGRSSSTSSAGLWELLTESPIQVRRLLSQRMSTASWRLLSEIMGCQDVK